MIVGVLKTFHSFDIIFPIHVTLEISCKSLKNMLIFHSKSRKIGENCHSRISLFTQMLKREITFMFDSRLTFKHTSKWMLITSILFCNTYCHLDYGFLSILLFSTTNRDITFDISQKIFFFNFFFHFTTYWIRGGLVKPVHFLLFTSFNKH